MRFKTFILPLFTIVSFAVSSQVPSPEEFLGYALGDRFTRHHQVMDYFRKVAESSDAVMLHPYGETYEKRPLYLAFISSQSNLMQLDQIREDNLRRAGILDGTPGSDVTVVWLSYNVHGNEAVSTEAAMKTLYELVRPGSEKTAWLENTIVVIDPCVNPDGRERYVNFYWQHANQPYNPNPDSWEHHEPWPGGRANHYLFDLNRDWAWLTQIESRERVKVYNQWLPQVHVDFHEQGINDPYYFAPAAEPFHELITSWQRDFQTQIGKNNARYFDENNWLYFTREIFDLLYPSYGDTYPTYNGAIGMTYEQGGSGRAGLGIIKQEHDTLTLKDRIDHHYTTGISTIEISSQNSDRLLAEYSRFFTQTAPSRYKTYVLKYDGDADKFNDLQSWLDMMGIQYGKTNVSRSVSGYHYGAAATENFSITSNDLVVSVQQPKSVLTSVLFEPQTRLMDSLTYDITSWAVPYAFGIAAFATSALLPVDVIKREPHRESKAVEVAYGYLFKWNNLKDAQCLAALLQEGIKVRFTTEAITVDGREFDRGSFIVTRGDNPQQHLTALIEDIADEFEREVYPLRSGFVTNGPDIGSGDVHFLKAPKVALVGGPGTSSLDFGATWHFFEQNLGYPVTNLSTEHFRSTDLDEYDVLIMPDGGYGNWDEHSMETLSAWVSGGGTLIAMQGAIRKLPKDLQLNPFNSDNEQAAFETREREAAEKLKLTPAAERERYAIREYVAGAVFKVAMDPTHPLAYGYPEEYYSLKTSSDRYGYMNQGNVGVIKSSDDHLSGFAGQMVKEKVGSSLVFGVQEKGAGHVVYMVDNPLFRSFWYNGKLLFVNALFYVGN